MTTRTTKSEGVRILVVTNSRNIHNKIVAPLRTIGLDVTELCLASFEGYDLSQFDLLITDHALACEVPSPHLRLRYHTMQEVAIIFLGPVVYNTPFRASIVLGAIPADEMMIFFTGRAVPRWSNEVEERLEVPTLLFLI